MNLCFLAVMVAGIVMIEYSFPLQGVRKYTVNGTRDKRCFESRGRG